MRSTRRSSETFEWLGWVAIGIGVVLLLLGSTTLLMMPSSSSSDELRATLRQLIVEVRQIRNITGCTNGSSNSNTTIIRDRVDNVSSILDQFLVFGQSLCNPQLGVYNVTSYFPLLRPEYDAIIRFDNVREPRDQFDRTRTNITFFPAVPFAWPNGSGIGVINPTLEGRNVLDHNVFKKFQSVPFSIGFFLNVSFFEVLPTDERLTVFLKNVEDRGPDNLEHRRYMAALTKSKVMGRYANRIRTFVANLYDSWVINRLPLLSTFKNRLIDFFLDIHLGTAKHPQFVKEYFDDFLFFISVTDPNELSANRTMKGHMNANCVREYVQARITVIVTEGLTDTITWHWIQAGMPIESVTIEAIHNIVAFSQYDNTVHLLVTQSLNRSLTPGTGGRSFLDLFRQAEAGNGTIVTPPGVFNSPVAYTGNSEELRIDVVREYMRIMLPNNLWFSKNVNNSCLNCSVHTQTRHIPLLIQIRAEYEAVGSLGPWVNSNSSGFNTGRALYAQYNPRRYAAFPGRFSDALVDGNDTFPAFSYNDTAPGLLCSIAGFDKSPLDAETQIPRGDGSMIPVFARPIYTAFGLGARRCPAEIFNQFIIFELFKAMQCLTFVDDCTANPTRCIPGHPNFRYGPIPLAPFKAAPDSLFVSFATPPSCPYPAPCATNPI